MMIERAGRMVKQGTKENGHVHFGYAVVFALVVTSFGPLSLGLSCAGIFYPAVAEHLDVGKGVLSYYTSFIWIASMLVLPLFGKLLARIDARACVSGSIVLVALAFVWLSFTNSLVHFYMGAFVIGIAVAMLLFLAPSTLVNRWFKKRAGFYVGLIMAFTGVGGVVWSSVGGMCIDLFGWSTTYLIFAGISFLTLPVGVFCIASWPCDKGLVPSGACADESVESEGSVESDGSNQTVSVDGVSARRAFRMPSFYVLLVICFTLNIGLYAYIMIPSYMNSIPLGLEIPLLGATASSVAMAGQTLSKVVLGYIGEKKSYIKTIVAVSLGLAGIGFLCVNDATVMTVYVGAFLFGVYYGITNVMMPIFTRRNFGNKEYSAIYSRIAMSASISNIVAALLWGTLIDLTSSYLYMFIGVAALLVVTIALLLAMPRIEKRIGESCGMEKELKGSL